MRMDRDSFVSAYDLVNNLSEEELTSVFFKFGEEHYSRRIARSIVEARSREPISTTIQLARLVGAVVPVRSFKYRIHPATRIFQALRIAVNRELESLDAGVQKGISLLAKGGRIGVISFHSLEDRIVKQTFKESASRGIIKVITKKPVEPQDKEIEENTPSRSAKLRVGEKI
jgi:16S rRNA (cytosine1402-N4)-methyltransferase